MGMSAQLPPGQLVAIHDNLPPNVYTLVEEVYTLGRSTTCLIIVDQHLVSRLHAKIERLGPRYVLSDTDSANGTFVNGRQIREPHLLRDRDEIGLGMATIHFRFLDPDPTQIPTNRLSHDERQMTFVLNGQRLQLSPAQYRLLTYLYQHAGTVCAKESLAAALWGKEHEYDPDIDAEALNRTVASLRQQLRRAAPEVEFIETRYGSGYMLRPW